MIHRKTNDLFHRMPLVCDTASDRVNSFVAGRKQAQDSPGSLHTIVSSVE